MTSSNKRREGKYALDLPEDTRVLHNAQLDQLFGAPVLIEHIVSVLSELLHVRADKHLAQLDEIAVLLVVDFDHAPWVRAPPDRATVACRDFTVRADDGEGDLGGNFLVFPNRLFVIVFVLWRLENTDLVVCDIGENLNRG